MVVFVVLWVYRFRSYTCKSSVFIEVHSLAPKFGYIEYYGVFGREKKIHLGPLFPTNMYVPYAEVSSFDQLSNIYAIKPFFFQPGIVAGVVSS